MDIGLLFPPRFIDMINSLYYDGVTEQASIESAIRDPAFGANPATHLCLYSDHSAVHAADVVRNLLGLLNEVCGALIPARDPFRFEFMRGYGALVAYLHDIGMGQISEQGRLMHAEFAAQEVFRPVFDPLVELLWKHNTGNIPWRLVNQAGDLGQDPKVVFRELLSMSVCNATRGTPIDVLAEPEALRARMQRSVGVELSSRYQHACRSTEPQVPNRDIDRFYQEFEHESFRWCVSDSKLLRAIRQDVVDTLRCLRAADAMRQRGINYTTSAGYEIATSSRTGNAVYLLRNRAGDQLFLLEVDNPLNAGEANLGGCTLSGDGWVRLSFLTGRFNGPEATDRAARAAAAIIPDVKADLIDSFQRSPGEDCGLDPAMSTIEEIRILIDAGNDDDGDFVRRVIDAIQERDPELARICEPGVSFSGVNDLEVDRFEAGRPVPKDLRTRRALVARIARTGYKVLDIDPASAFDNVRLVRLQPGEHLVKAWSPAAFVYIPTSGMLEIRPLSGHAGRSSHAWVPIGDTSAIRDAVRNANVVALQECTALAIPRETYLRNWCRTYGAGELVKILERGLSGSDSAHPAAPENTEFWNEIESKTLHVPVEELSFVLKHWRGERSDTMDAWYLRLIRGFDKGSMATLIHKLMATDYAQYANAIGGQRGSHLDIGCGNAYLSHYIHTRQCAQRPDFETWCCDIYRAEFAAEVEDALHEPDSGFRFFLSTAGQPLPFPDGSFGSASFFYVLHHCEERSIMRSLLEEAARILVAGGKLIVVEEPITPETDRKHREVMDDLVNEIFNEEAYHNDFDTGNFFEEDKLLDYFHRAGLDLETRKSPQSWSWVLPRTIYILRKPLAP